jgi:hypothetical protein
MRQPGETPKRDVYAKDIPYVSASDHGPRRGVDLMGDIVKV